ncbi:hypothetical protein GJ496_001712 [Pomphorhynchus laevis]|nr:hypothetical protein GJ496_001708 [Pomphorhynchus laevis]KAI0987136.1 hypothetical protein GJ496_001712 [Pomphorhynchus laevis]
MSLKKATSDIAIVNNEEFDEHLDKVFRFLDHDNDNILSVSDWANIAILLSIPLQDAIEIQQVVDDFVSHNLNAQVTRSVFKQHVKEQMTNLDQFTGQDYLTLFLRLFDHSGDCLLVRNDLERMMMTLLKCSPDEVRPIAEQMMREADFNNDEVIDRFELTKILNIEDSTIE